MERINTATNEIVGPPKSEIVGPRHEDYQYWVETFAHEQALSDALEAGPVDTPMAPKHVQVPALALVLTREEAAELLRVSVQHFDRHVRPHVREVQVGRLVRYPIDAITRYVNDNARRALR